MDRPALKQEPTKIRQESERLRLVVYGEPGVGKTTLAMTFPKPLVVNTDGGLVSVTVNRPGEDLGEQWVPEGHKDLEALYFWIKSRIGEYETIVIDSLDELVFLLMDELVDAGAAYDRKKQKDTHPVAEFVPEQAEYLANQRQMHSFLHALRQLGRHVVITSGVRAKLGEKRTVDVAPGLQTIVERWSSILGELLVVEDESKPEVNGKRALIIPPSNNQRRSKNRFFHQLGNYVVDPGYQTIWGPIEEAFAKGAAA
jgi:hypothetical protein